MKCPKILLVPALGALISISAAGIASATTVTSGGSSYTGTIRATSTNLALSNAFYFGTIKCGHSFVEGSVVTHGGTSTAVIALANLSFTSCTNGEPTSPVSLPGELEIHGFGGNGNGTATWSFAVVEVHKTLVGSCTFRPNGTDIGLFTGSKNTGATAVLDIGNATIPQSSPNPFCPTSATLSGNYTFTTPDKLDID